MLRLELSATAGDTIGNVTQEMCEAATRLGLIIDLQFNDVRLCAYPGGSAESLASGYYAELKRPAPRFATTSTHQREAAKKGDGDE